MMRLFVLITLLVGCSNSVVKQAVRGQSCWDLDGNGHADPSEDTNEDGTVDVHDCRGSDGSDGVDTDGLSCWDLDGDGVMDPAEDTNGDGRVDVLDCRDTPVDTGADTRGDTGTAPEPEPEDRRTELLECVVAAGGCDLVLTPNADNQFLLQGAGYWADDGLNHAGETVCIPGGTYDHISFSGLLGEPGNPVFITNCGTERVVVNRAGLGAGLTAHGARYLVISGTGDPGQAQGFLFTNAGAGNTVMDMQAGVSDVELEYLEVSGPAYAGIGIRTYPYCNPDHGRDAFTQYNTRVHHSYVHDVGGEGLYIGPSHYHEAASPTSDASCAPGLPEAPLRGVEIHHNTIEDVGRDGIQVGAAIEGMSIHDNVVRRYALAGSYGHMGGIQINPGSVGRVYGNWIESVSGGTSDNAFQLAGGEDGPTYLYNNVVVGTRTAFIALSRMADADSPVYFLNNTVLNHSGDGSHTLTLFCAEAGVQEFFFRNNIFTGYETVGGYIYTDGSGGVWTTLVGGGLASTCPINGVVRGNALDEEQQLDGNLYVQDPAAVGFVDLAAGDFHLTADSPAVGAGDDLSDRFTDDIEGRSRGTGAWDMGAYAY